MLVEMVLYTVRGQSVVIQEVSNRLCASGGCSTGPTHIFTLVV